MVGWEIRTGGLMRCCLGTLNEVRLEQADAEPKEGDIIMCRYCSNPGNPGGMIYTAGAWQWNHRGSP